MKGRRIRLAVLLLTALMVLVSCGVMKNVLPAGNLGASSSSQTVKNDSGEKPLPETSKEAPAEKDGDRVTDAPARAPTEAPEAIIEPQAIADYLFQYGKLPDNFITKKEAQALGWDSSYNYVSDVAPGKSIGGDRFGNYEGLLPKRNNVTYREADCNYTGGKRNAERIIYSSDGRVWYTNDHYQTFTELKPSN